MSSERTAATDAKRVAPTHTKHAGSPRPGTAAPLSKGAATLARNKAILRAERLAEIDAQIADGRLIVRRMTVTPPGGVGKAAAPKAKRR